MREADPAVGEWTHCRYGVETFVAGEAVLVRLPGELIGVDGNVQPMGDVERHKGSGEVLVVMQDLVLELPVGPHCEEVHTIRDMIDCMQDGLNGGEEGQPDVHVLWVLHVGRESWRAFLSVCGSRL